MNDLRYIPVNEFARILNGVRDATERLTLFADMCRLNTLVEIKKAGSGHLGSSLSAMDIVCLLYLEVLNVRQLGLDHPDRDMFFSSKGHDVPGLYAVLVALGLMPESRLGQLRRIGGLDGHPDIHVPGMEANTGSLGMGISKARGLQRAKRLLGRQGRVVVMTGDGELQEGQIWESLQTSVHQRASLTVVVDHNKLQTDMLVDDITALGDLEAKFRAFGAEVVRCSGHDFPALRRALLPPPAGVRVVIADTIKGRGISFMEEISSQRSPTGKYRWHSGAPADEPFRQGFTELQERLDRRLAAAGLAPLQLRPFPHEEKRPSAVTREFVAAGYGEELVRLGAGNPRIVVLDGDLSADCRVRAFEEAYPDRFIENGIAEQDMVSMAGGLARLGLVPVVNSFSSFLCARANEQVYNNACEDTKVIYAAHFAGFIPAGPGKSHQSVRDISLFAALPNMVIVQPATPAEAAAALRWAVEENSANTMLRMNIGPSPRSFEFLPGEDFRCGFGRALRRGPDATIVAYGPVMLHEAMVCAELLEPVGISVGVVNLPWLNRPAPAWLDALVAASPALVILEDHMVAGGVGERLLRLLAERGDLAKLRCQVIGLTTLPACGTPAEVLKHHALDGASLARRVQEFLGGDQSAVSEAHTVFDTPEAAQ
ncbi:MAG TPA: transketolase C-terminal domain-containing protein [Opitutaceae bacterium]|nr:transketolase C-terminal domain-containing protein [Opitutaceae bacterium]